MAWKETCVMKERILFIEDYLRDEWTMAELSRAYGISRKTAYKWVRVFERGGYEALGDRSRVPKTHPNATPEPIEHEVLAARAAHRTWGPRKLRAWLARHDPDRRWPAPSTIGAMLARHGLTTPRRRKRRNAPYSEPFLGTTAPNDTWCADFKGWFRTGDGQRCDPLTISDAHSRYVLRCQSVSTTRSPWVRPIFEAAFREYGLPRAIRTDNGAPFSSLAVAGLSRLSVWWIKLGIVPERIEPGHPEQNGRHERMHLTLKQECAAPPKANARAQQRAFNHFRAEFNHERPHEALGQQPPAWFYHASPRPYPLRPPTVHYPDSMQVHKVQEHGQIRWGGRRLFISQTLWGEPVGLEQIDERQWKVYFAHVALGTFDEDRETLYLRPIEPSGRSARRKKRGRGQYGGASPPLTPPKKKDLVH